MQKLSQMVSCVTYGNSYNSPHTENYLYSLLQTKIRGRKTLIAVIENSFIDIYDLNTSALLHSFGQTGVSSLSFLSQRQLIMALTTSLAIWDLEEKRFTKSVKCRCNAHFMVGYNIIWYEKHRRIFGVWNTRTDQHVSRENKHHLITDIQALGTNRLITYDSMFFLHIWDLHTVEHLQMVRLNANISNEKLLSACLCNPNTIITVSKNIVLLQDLYGERIYKTIVWKPTSTHSTCKIDEQRILVLTADDLGTGAATLSLFIWNWESVEIEAIIYSDYRVKHSSIDLARYIVHGKMLFYSKGKQVFIYDLQSRCVVKTVKANFTNLSGFAIWQ
jgi:hypothetical protein